MLRHVEGTGSENEFQVTFQFVLQILVLSTAAPSVTDQYVRDGKITAVDMWLITYSGHGL